jgi:hypothetical protein
MNELVKAVKIFRKMVISECDEWNNISEPDRYNYIAKIMKEIRDNYNISLLSLFIQADKAFDRSNYEILIVDFSYSDLFKIIDLMEKYASNWIFK